jgi:hypothetical protein
VTLRMTLFVAFLIGIYCGAVLTLTVLALRFDL